MPPNQHLRWAEITNFAPGLWENADWLMPANAAQTMMNCYPQVGGGLRAFFRGTTISTSGVVDITKERVIGLHARGNIPGRAAANSNTIDRYMMTYMFDSSAGAGSKARPKLYRMDETNGETTWTQIFRTSGTNQFNFATSDDNAPRKCSFRFFRLSSGTPNDQYVVFALRYTAASTNGPGLYRLNYNDLSTAQKAIEITTSITGASNPNGSIATHQARFLVAHGGGNGERICYSDTGTVTFGASNFIDVEPNQDLPNILALNGNAPGDLLVAKNGAPWVTLQGDITSPTVVSMSQGQHIGSGEQDMARLPGGGLVFISTDGYVYETDGHNFTNLSQQLNSFTGQFDYTGAGDIGFLNQFLFLGRGYVFDIASKSWFKQNVMLGSIFNVERASRTIWGTTTTGVSFGLVKFSPFPANDRLGTYTWKSAPLTSEDGRQAHIREVQVFVKSYDASATVVVTVNGTSYSITCPSVGSQQLTFTMDQRAEVLDVQIVPTAGNSASFEAPSIDRVRVGFRTGHLLPNG